MITAMPALTEPIRFYPTYRVTVSGVNRAVMSTKVVSELSFRMDELRSNGGLLRGYYWTSNGDLYAYVDPGRILAAKEAVMAIPRVCSLTDTAIEAGMTPEDAQKQYD